MKFETVTESAVLLCEKIDLEKSIIHGVKLLGLNSKNGRTYRQSAVESAVPLYEGAKVNINHPEGKPSAPRNYQDRLGIIRNVEFRENDGLFGDLHFNPKHPCAEMFLYDAQMQPTAVGMSHNILAKAVTENKKQVIEEIQRVVSVDVVADPATTASLFESEDPPTEPPTEPPTDPPTDKPETDTVEALTAAFPQLIEQLITESTASIRVNVAAAIKALMAAQLPYGAWDNGMLDQIVQATMEAKTEEINGILDARKALLESIRKTVAANPPRSNAKPTEPLIQSGKEFAEAIRKS